VQTPDFPANSNPDSDPQQTTSRTTLRSFNYQQKVRYRSHRQQHWPKKSFI
jgi:hypothetical protein